MDDLDRQAWAVDALGALVHATRLCVFRMLVKAGNAGVIAEYCGVSLSTMSHRLATLDRVGLVHSECESRPEIGTKLHPKPPD